MTWILLVGNLFTFLGPIVKWLLEKYLAPAAQELEAEGVAATPENMHLLWDRALAKMPRAWLWGGGTRRVAEACKKVCLRRDDSLFINQGYGHGPNYNPFSMNDEEAQAIAAALDN